MENDKTTKKRLKKAKRALELYRNGLTGEEIAVEMKKTEVTIHRYFQLLGGLTNEDKAKYYKNRPTKKQLDQIHKSWQEKNK